MEKLALEAGAISFAAVEIPPDFPPKWDLGDDLPPSVSEADLRDLLNKARPYKPSASSRNPARETQNANSQSEQEALNNWRGGDVDSGKVFSARNQGQLLYVSRAKIWLRWDGVRWADLTDEDVVRSGKQVAETVFDHAFTLPKLILMTPRTRRCSQRRAFSTRKST